MTLGQSDAREAFWREGSKFGTRGYVLATVPRAELWLLLSLGVLLLGSGAFRVLPLLKLEWNLFPNSMNQGRCTGSSNDLFRALSLGQICVAPSSIFGICAAGYSKNVRTV